MGNLSTRPWFLEDIISTIRGIYFSSYMLRDKNLEYWRGQVSMLCAIILAIGGNPENVLTPEDVQMVRKEWN